MVLDGHLKGLGRVRRNTVHVSGSTWPRCKKQEAGPGTGTRKSWRWDGVEAHWDRLSPQSEAYANAVLLCRLSHKCRVNKPAG